MTELKTLKDLLIWHRVKPVSKTAIQVGNTITNCWNQEMVQPNDLKHEAIKWVKKYKTTINFMCDWEAEFKKFHNITEEDLK